MEEEMSRLRLLLLAPFCDPDATSMPLVAYAHAAALAELHDVTLVIGAPVERNVRRAQGPFRAFEVIRMPRLERVYDWVLRRIFKYNFSSQALTAFGYPFFVAFEWSAWRQLRPRLRSGEFDIVLRLLPMTAVLPSVFAFFLGKGPVPFVIGPINGGLPFVSGFKQAERQKEWISGFRKLYRVMPFARSTYRNAAAVIVASSQTYSEFSKYGDKLFYIPENGVSGSMILGSSGSSDPDGKLRLIFVGGLVPCKACDLALRASAPLLKQKRATLTILGDGPERGNLENLAKELGIAESVSFRGYVSHQEVLTSLRSSEIMIFPSIRDFGGGVVFEALACGAVPIVADFGGPGDIVRPDVGFKVALTNEDDMVEKMEGILQMIARDRKLLERLRENGRSYAVESLTWNAKAQNTTKILDWILGRGPKPAFPSPKLVKAAGVSAGHNQDRTLSPSN
jgi:glycosyltransferase involved in cell wall biosynthesis